MLDIWTIVIWAVMIGMMMLCLIILLRIIKDRDKSRVLHQLSDGTFAIITGSVKDNKLKAKNKKFDLKDIRVYALRTFFGFKPFYITSHGRNKPLQIEGQFLKSEELTPNQVKELGELSILDKLLQAKVRGGKSDKVIIAVAIMSFIMGVLLVLAYMGMS